MAEKTSGYVEMRTKRAVEMLRSMETFDAPEYGVDLYMLESPVTASRVSGVVNHGWKGLQQQCDEMARVARVP